MPMSVKRQIISVGDLATGKAVYVPEVRLMSGKVSPEGMYHVRETHVPLDSDEPTRLYINCGTEIVYLDSLPILYAPTEADFRKGYVG